MYGGGSLWELEILPAQLLAGFRLYDAALNGYLQFFRATETITE
jgi:hypothetical protein